MNRRPAVLDTWFTCVPAATLLWRRSFALFSRRRVLRWMASVEAPHQLRSYPTRDGVLAALRATDCRKSVASLSHLRHSGRRERPQRDTLRVTAATHASPRRLCATASGNGGGGAVLPASGRCQWSPTIPTETPPHGTGRCLLRRRPSPCMSRPASRPHCCHVTKTAR